MKLSKQERIGALIIIIIVILGLGAWLLVKPKIEDIGTSKKSLEAKQTEYNQAVEQQQKKAPLREQIIEAYQSGEHMADMFFPEMTSYEADAAFREFLSQCTAKVVVQDLTVGDPGTATLGTQFFTPSSVSYDLKTYATQGLETDEETAARNARREVLQSTLGNAQTIGASQVNFTVTAIEREELVKFMDEVNSYFRDENGNSVRKAIKVNGLTLDYWEVTEKYDALVEELNKTMEEAGRAALTAATGLPTQDTTQQGTATTVTEPDNQQNAQENAGITDYIYSWSDTMTFYCIERMQDPTPQLDAQDGISA
ncbi:MAG: hypothetical protein NC401_19285 [Ruminococcus sp.]|nr:hypothetical protein [Ruminococcus sp.]